MILLSSLSNTFYLNSCLAHSMLTTPRTFTAAIYIPSIHSLSHKFREVSTIGAIIPFSIFVLGYAFGPIIAAPCSETFGRRIVYWTCIPCYAFFILGAGLAKKFSTLIICRFLAGIFGSPGVSIGSGVIADIWRAEERTVPMTAFVVSPFIGPTVGYVFLFIVFYFIFWGASEPEKRLGQV